MPRTPPAPPLTQLPRFAETVSTVRVWPELTEWRYCRMVGLSQGSAARCWLGTTAAATIKTAGMKPPPLGGRGIALCSTYRRSGRQPVGNLAIFYQTDSIRLRRSMSLGYRII
jgi:hypothetical protein